MDELFRVRAGRESLDLAEELGLIAMAQGGDDGAMWALLVQYRGALQKAANRVRASVRGMSREQVEDLESDLVLAAVEAVRAFDAGRFVRLSQVLPARLRDVSLEMATALRVPRGTLALWFKVWRAAGQDFAEAARVAPGMGMAANTFRAVQHALSAVGSEWVVAPWSADHPAPDEETYRLAHRALGLLTAEEREVVELAYGFRGDPKSDGEVAEVMGTPRVTASKRRERGLERMRAGLAA